MQSNFFQHINQIIKVCECEFCFLEGEFPHKIIIFVGFDFFEEVFWELQGGPFFDGSWEIVFFDFGNLALERGGLLKSFFGVWRGSALSCICIV